MNDAWLTIGVIECFLGIHILWHTTQTTVTVHLNQSHFVANLVENFFHESRDAIPITTPYRCIPIDSIALSTDNDASLAQLWYKEAYQSLIGSIMWLARSFRGSYLSVLLQ